MDIKSVGSAIRSILDDDSKPFELIASACESELDLAVAKFGNDASVRCLIRLAVYSIFSKALWRKCAFDVVCFRYERAVKIGFDSDWYRVTADLIFVQVLLDVGKSRRALWILRKLNRYVRRRTKDANKSVRRTIKRLIAKAREEINSTPDQRGSRNKWGRKQRHRRR